jgi:hypothetical protein
MPATAAGTARAAGRGGATDPDGARRRTIIAATVGTLVFGVVLVVLAVQLIGGDDGQRVPNSVGERPATSTTPSGGGSGGGTATAQSLRRGDYTVAVLNGTTITNLARGAANKIEDAGYVAGRVTNDTTNQARDATVVYYARGARRPALDVAKLIKVSPSAVRALGSDPTEQGLVLLAGEDADVIVSVGQDQAQ